MSATELLEQVKALPSEERRSFFAALHDVEKELMMQEHGVTELPDSEEQSGGMRAMAAPGWENGESAVYDPWHGREPDEELIKRLKTEPRPSIKEHWRKLHELGMPYWTEEDAEKFDRLLRGEDIYR